jgi:hypothetical protein
MKNSFHKTDNLQIENSLQSKGINRNFRTTDINILLNRVKLEKKSQLKKRIIISASIISILSFLSIILLGNQ